MNRDRAGEEDDAASAASEGEGAAGPPRADGREAGEGGGRRRIRRRWIQPGHEVLLLTLLALGIRLLAWLLRPAVLPDTADLFEAAERFRTEGWGVLLHVRHHPLPVILLGLVPAGVDAETWASVGAAVISSLAVGPIHVVARCTGGRHAATLACLLYAVLPKLVSVSSVPLAEPVFLPLFAAAFSSSLVAAAGRTRARRIGRAGLSGALAGLAYLARPEGLVAGAAVGVAAFVHGRRSERLRAGLVAALAFLVVAGPYVAELSSSQGHLAFSTKKDVAAFLGSSDAPRDAVDPGAPPLVEGVRGLADALWGALGPVLVLAVVGALARKRWRRGPRASARCVVLGAALVLCAAIVRLRAGWGYAGGRHAASVAVLLLPFAGEAMVTLVGFLSRAVRRRRAALVLAMLLVIPLAVTAVLRPDGESGLRERVLGERIAAAETRRGGDGEVVVASFTEPLVAYYADRELRRLGSARHARNLRLRRDFKELMKVSADLPTLRAKLGATLHEEGARWIVLRYWDDPDDLGATPGESLASELLRDGLIVPPAIGSEDLAAFELSRR